MTRDPHEFLERECLDEVAARGQLPNGCDTDFFISEGLVLASLDGYSLTARGLARRIELHARKDDQGA